MSRQQRKKIEIEPSHSDGTAACVNFLEKKKVVYITKRLNRTPTGVV